MRRGMDAVRDVEDVHQEIENQEIGGDWLQEVCEDCEPLVGIERMVFGVVVVDVMMGWEEIKGRKVASDGAE